MKTSLALSLAALCLLGGAAPVPAASPDPKAGVYAFTLKTIDGREVSLASYSGKVLLLVNVASECGFTPQYKDLEALYLKYKPQGFMILGFPSNDFLHQEPGTDAEIKSFCDSRFHVTFDMFSKIDVRGSTQAPLYHYLTAGAGFNGPISWNFNKFLVGRDGRVLARWGSTTKPLSPDLVTTLEKTLK